ncbi:hypothetical protein AB6A23_03100 [Paenibacillus tarimensis]
MIINTYFHILETQRTGAVGLAWVNGRNRPVRELRDGATQPQGSLNLAWERNGGTGLT